VPLQRVKYLIAKKQLINPDFDRDFVELVISKGYKVEEHFVTTSDGYVLGIHRILPPREKDNSKDNRGNNKKVVFFQHGFLQNSEAWIVRGPGKALPYILADQGYDVWLGNNRGNKYSFKHKTLSQDDTEFWDFCIDQLALIDLPSMLQYVLSTTKSNSLGYIGFSQGTAQAFACFSMNADLASKINVFIALGATSRVKELRNSAVAALTTSRPELLFLLFGKKILLGQCLFYRQRMSVSLFVFIIDICCNFLFGWKMNNIDPAEKPILYSHLYSYGSVKNLVHWFQITRMKRFQMFDDKVRTMEPNLPYNNYVLPSYQISKIQCPIAVFCGGRDTIPDTNAILAELPPSSQVHIEPDYEHLDFQWAMNAPERIYSKVLSLLNEHSKSSSKTSIALDEVEITTTHPCANKKWEVL